ncbi:hypothetical protein [Amycolatopsis sp. NBC_00438]|uniref:hypothetical protein n=1 Tax=Amycolatopsis sp. NBC_00438 TaxID=2903558 RepID=UPI002E1B8EA2
MIDLVVPSDLSWGDVDPRHHPFDAASALGVISALAPAARVPARPVGAAADPDVIAWSGTEGAAWADELTRAMTGRFGRWAAGWRWAHDEGDIGGGPVAAWCCPRDSITTPAATLERVAAALCEWRGWLEELAGRFDRYPPDAVPAEERRRVPERATTDLVTAVVERTGAGDAWYLHCKQVLTWFLTRWGVTAETAEAEVERAVSGDFESWTAPDTGLVDEVAGRLAVSSPPESRG